MKNDFFLRVGLILLITGIIAGALGAHGLRAYLSPGELESFKTGTLYQLLHSVLFIAFGLYHRIANQPLYRLSGLYTALIGVLLFSLSIYLLSTASLHGVAVRWLGPVTPLGGVMMITGWSIVFIQTFTSKN